VKKLILLMTLTLIAPGSLCAQRKHTEPETPEAERSAANAHSFMELFTKLERDWMDAVRKKDREALEEMLAPEFMLRTSADPQHPVARAEWIQNALTKYEIHSYTQHDFVIRAFLGVAVVSFVQSQQATVNGRKQNGDYLIVDIWETNHGKWQPATRFQAAMDKH
jgi:Domain of unknown function (DUF4440)